MANQFTFKCLVCSRGADTVAYVEREISALKHSYKRVSEATGISRSSLHRHISRCRVRTATLAGKDLRCPPHFHARVTMPDGQVFFHKGDAPVSDRLRGTSTQLPVIEVEVVFEPPVPPRQPKNLIAEKPVEQAEDFLAMSPQLEK